MADLGSVLMEMVGVLISVTDGNGTSGMPLDFECGTQLEQFFGPDGVDLSGLSDDEAQKVLLSRLSTIHEQIGNIMAGNV